MSFVALGCPNLCDDFWLNIKSAVLIEILFKKAGDGCEHGSCEAKVALKNKTELKCEHNILRQSIGSGQFVCLSILPEAH